MYTWYIFFKRLHLESSKQNYYIISLWVIIKAIFIHNYYFVSLRTFLLGFLEFEPPGSISNCRLRQGGYDWIESIHTSAKCHFNLMIVLFGWGCQSLCAVYIVQLRKASERKAKGKWRLSPRLSPQQLISNLTVFHCGKLGLVRIQTKMNWVSFDWVDLNTTGLNLLHGAKFQRFLSGKSVFLNSKFQIREFHAHCMEWGEVLER